MFDLSDNYYLRKHFFETNEVPTQSMVRQKMNLPLAKVYFDSMTPKLKVLAGLEPLLKGGGNDWYVPPKELLKGRSVLKPVSKKVLNNLSNHGIDNIGSALFEQHRKNMKLEEEKEMNDADQCWRNQLACVCKQDWIEASVEATRKNTEFMHNAFNYLSHLYRRSFDKFESLFHEAAIKEINTIRERAHEQMRSHQLKIMNAQATMLYDRYAKKLMEEKERLKAEFIKTIDEHCTEVCNKIHDLRVEKHVAVEKVRKYLECRNLACQIYVALKEREVCKTEMDEAKHKHKIIAKKLAENIAFKDFEIHLELEKERKREKFKVIWKKKVSHVVKKFQQFVSYCLRLLPDHAEFFLNIEKLMWLQLNEVLEEPNAESIIEVEEEPFHTPVPKPHPFYLFCDRGFKPKLDEDLCPRYRSSTSQLPVIVVNKRCMYAACDNFVEFNTKIKQYISGNRGDDDDFVDNSKYETYVPVKYTSSQQLLELKLESSLLNVMQQEIGNIRDMPIDCGVCKLPYCFCTPPKVGKLETSTSVAPPTPSKPLPDIKLKRRSELTHEREPKWDSFFEYVKPKKCSCEKTAKKHLVENLPAYMRRMSTYEAPDLPNYETCPVTTLKKLVKQARVTTAPPSAAASIQFTTRDVGTQYDDEEFLDLCNCFSADNISHILSDLNIDAAVLDTSKSNDEFEIVGTSMVNTFLTKNQSSFANDRAYSLRKIVKDFPSVQEIFKREDSEFK